MLEYNSNMQYTQISRKFSKDFFNLAKEAQDIVITSHVSPDEDSIASVLVLFWFLKEKFKNKNIRILYTGQKNSRFKTFKNFDKIEFVPDVSEVVDKIDLLILLDASQYNRVSYNPRKLKENIAKTICIDHHNSPVDNFDISLVVPSLPANTELIYKEFFNTDKKINKDLAKIFLLGILGDTGNFAYLKPSQTDTLLVAKKLLDICNMEIQELQSGYRILSKRTFTLIQELVKNTQYHQIKNWPLFQTSFLNRETKNEGNYLDSEIKEANHVYMSNYIRGIEGFPWGFVLTPKDNGDCGISFRSLPQSVNVRILAEQMKIGGGHDRAAGGEFKKEEKEQDVKKCLEKIIKWIKQNKPVIN